MNPENIMLDAKDHVVYDSVYMKCLELATHRDRNQIGGRLELEGGSGGERGLNGYKVFFSVVKISWNWIEVVVAQHRECTKCH